MKLGLAPTNHPPKMVKVCICEAAFAIGNIGCHNNEHHRTYCHLYLADFLYTLLKQRQLAAIQKKQEVEQTLPEQDSVQGIRADIRDRRQHLVPQPYYQLGGLPGYSGVTARVGETSAALQAGYNTGGANPALHYPVLHRDIK